MRVVILEGCRGTGKSTLAFKLRQRIPETTLINFTGFHADGEEGLKKIEEYYYAWTSIFPFLFDHDSKYVFDRFFFTEKVFSQLYKTYDFSEIYEKLCRELMDNAAFGVKIDIVFLTINDKEELAKRLTRDKVPFGKINENTEEAFKQQELYKKEMNDLALTLKLHGKSRNINIHTIDTNNKDSDAVFQEITSIL